MTENAIQPLIQQLATSAHLSFDQALRAFQIIMNGGATPAQMGAFLMALKLNGESVDEIAAGAAAIRAKAKSIKSPGGTIDVCGTGGDGHNTLNISTAAAFVVAACGVKVAKHGGNAVSSASGSADVFKELGINIEASPKRSQEMLESIGMCFLYAPFYHTAMRHIAPIRQELKIRSIFNLLGPLTNPAMPEFQLVGVYDKKLVSPIAEVLQKLGTKSAWVIASDDGLDEISIGAKTTVASLKNNIITEFKISPEDAGFEFEAIVNLKGGDIAHNTSRLRAVLLGEKSAYRNAVLLNAAAALVIAGVAENLKIGAELAANKIDEGKAYSVLQKLSEESYKK